MRSGLIVRLAMGRAAVLLLLCATVGAACGPGGLRRSDLDRWDQRDYPRLGFRLELPSKLPAPIRDDTDLWARIHVVHSGPLAVAEPFVVASVAVRRYDATEWQQHIVELDARARAQGIEELGRLLRWQAEWHDRAAELEVATVVYFRREVRCSGGAVVAAEGELKQAAANRPHDAADRVALGRILNSVQCLR